MIAVFITFAVILLPWWIGYTIVVFGRVAVGLARAIAALATALWIIACVLWAISSAALARRPAQKRDDETNVIQFRRRG